MNWNKLSAADQDAILSRAAGLHDDVEALDMDETRAANFVSMADLADYARGAPSARPVSAIRLALRTDPRMRALLEQLLDHYAQAGIPLAAAASSGTVSKRRDPATGLEITLTISSAEPQTVFLRLDAPTSMRPLHRLVAADAQGQIIEIPIEDAGEDDIVEILIGRDSPEFQLLIDEGSKLWLS